MIYFPFFIYIPIYIYLEYLEMSTFGLLNINMVDPIWLT